MMRLLSLMLFALLVGCSGGAVEKMKADPNDARIVVQKRIDGLTCRKVYILKDHGGVMTCRDSSGNLIEYHDASLGMPWGRVRTYYPNGQLKSEEFYESMSAQPAYRKEYYEDGSLKYSATN